MLSWSCRFVSWLCFLLCWLHCQAECPHGWQRWSLGAPVHILPISPSQLKESILSPVDLIKVLVTIWLEGPRSAPWTGSGEKGSVIFELLGEWRRGDSWREAGQTENPTMFSRKMNLNILKSYQTDYRSLLQNPFILLDALPLYTPPAQHFDNYDTNLLIDTVTQVIPSVLCFGNFKTCKEMSKKKKIPHLV